MPSIDHSPLIELQPPGRELAIFVVGRRALGTTKSRPLRTAAVRLCFAKTTRDTSPAGQP
jgi:hypothetical protein